MMDLYREILVCQQMINGVRSQGLLNRQAQSGSRFLLNCSQVISHFLSGTFYSYHMRNISQTNHLRHEGNYVTVHMEGITFVPNHQ